MLKLIRKEDLPFRKATFEEKIDLVNRTILANEAIKMEKDGGGVEISINKCLIETYKVESGGREFLSPDDWLNNGARIYSSVKPYWIWKNPNLNFSNSHIDKIREMLIDEEMLCVFSNLQVDI